MHIVGSCIKNVPSWKKKQDDRAQSGECTPLLECNLFWDAEPEYGISAQHKSSDLNQVRISGFWPQHSTSAPNGNFNCIMSHIVGAAPH